MIRKYRPPEVSLRKIFILEYKLMKRIMPGAISPSERKRLIMEYELEYHNKFRVWTTSESHAGKVLRKKFPQLKGWSWDRIRNRYLLDYPDIPRYECFPESELKQHDYTPPDRVRIAPYV